MSMSGSSSECKGLAERVENLERVVVALERELSGPAEDNPYLRELAQRVVALENVTLDLLKRIEHVEEGVAELRLERELRRNRGEGGGAP
jgi:uncharacterized protein involved in exopolysaccharide biosynthesis